MPNGDIVRLAGNVFKILKVTDDLHASIAPKSQLLDIFMNEIQSPFFTSRISIKTHNPE